MTTILETTKDYLKLHTLTLKEGDMVILTINNELTNKATPEDFKNAIELLKINFPLNKAVIMHEGMSFSTLSQEQLKNIGLRRINQ